MAAGSEFSLLFRKYVDGVASHEERLAFLSLADQEEMQAELAQLVDAELRLRNTAYILDEEEQQEILNNIYSAARAKPVKIRKMVSLWPRIGVAAAAVAAIVFGVWFFNGERGVLKQVQDDVTYKNDIAPGKNTATLTLANGKTIMLSDAKNGVIVGANNLTYNDGSKITARHPELVSGPPHSLIAATTPRGGTYQVILSDGTKVWLNADSKLEFPSQFNGKERKILLDGEAYFEVTKDKEHPFIVESRGQLVEVLGTHFNINAYEDEAAVKTTLLEGSVRVAIGGRHPDLRQDDVVLKPNQQAQVSEKGIKVMDNADIEDITAWKNGYFKFGENLESIMAKVSRWYDVEVIYEIRPDPNFVFNGEISRNKNLSQILDMLEYTGNVHFKIEGRKIVVKK